jgi:hypothetical protein
MYESYTHREPAPGTGIDENSIPLLYHSYSSYISREVRGRGRRLTRGWEGEGGRRTIEREAKDRRRKSQEREAPATADIRRVAGRLGAQLEAVAEENCGQVFAGSEMLGGNERISSTESSDGGPVTAARTRDLRSEARGRIAVANERWPAGVAGARGPGGRGGVKACLAD